MSRLLHTCRQSEQRPQRRLHKVPGTRPPYTASRLPGGLRLRQDPAQSMGGMGDRLRSEVGKANCGCLGAGRPELRDPRGSRPPWRCCCRLDRREHHRRHQRCIGRLAQTGWLYGRLPQHRAILLPLIDDWEQVHLCRSCTLTLWRGTTDSPQTPSSASARSRRASPRYGRPRSLATGSWELAQDDTDEVAISSTPCA